MLSASTSVLITESLYAFQTFLMSEYSEENLAFYLACEDYMNTPSPSKLSSKAKKIYDEFIVCDAPREVIVFVGLTHIQYTVLKTKHCNVKHTINISS